MMENHDETKRLREAFAATSPEDVSTADCPPAERLWEAVKDELDPAEFRKVLGHVASCPVCTESWRLASEIEGEGALEGIQAPRRVERRRFSRWLGVASAAAAVFAIFVVGTMLSDRFSTGSIARSGDAAELSLITEGVALSRSECRPRWVAVEGATYNVRVLTEGFEVLVEENGLAAPEFLVPQSAFENLVGESTLLLQIEARRPRELPQSTTIRLPC